jgi:hypothetical protein
VIVETVFIHESGETVSAGKLHVPASKLDAQGFGSALTYARRYSLMAACGIAPEDDDGNAASKKPAAPVVITEKQIEETKKNLDKAKEEGNLKSYFFSLTPEMQEKVRDYANQLKAAA